MPPRCSRMIRRGLTLLLGFWVTFALAALPAQAAEPARVTVSVDSGSKGAFRVTADVVDANGEPVASAPVVLKARTTFGWLSIAKASTGATGRVEATLPATLRSGEISAEAGDDGQVRATVRFGEGKFAAPSVRPGRDALSSLSPQPGFISPYPVLLQVALLVVILGGIWTTYGYVGWLLSQIRNAG